MPYRRADRHTGPFPPHLLFALTAGATGVICGAVACATRIAMANFERMIRTCVDERLQLVEQTTGRIDHNTGRIVEIEHDVLREMLRGRGAA